MVLAPARAASPLDLIAIDLPDLPEEAWTHLRRLVTAISGDATMSSRPLR
jgi:hypothetical protein